MIRKFTICFGIFIFMCMGTTTNAQESISWEWKLVEQWGVRWIVCNWPTTSVPEITGLPMEQPVEENTLEERQSFPAHLGADVTNHVGGPVRVFIADCGFDFYLDWSRE